MNSDLKDKIFSVTAENFETVSLEVFRFQATKNSIYRKYLEFLKVNPLEVSSIEDIPFFPISFFKTQRVLIEGLEPEAIFSSSGTTGDETSKHFVASLDVYRESFRRCFERFYGNPSEFCILALLPSYLERQGSSLVFMVDDLIKMSGHSSSGFFLKSTDDLISLLRELSSKKQKTLLIGVTFALLELTKKVQLHLPNTIIMETGGMKGRDKELVRSELHSILKSGFGVENIHSEYGMTELLSQAFSKGEGIFQCPPWMSIRIRDPYDPFSLLPNGRTGALNVIDLANIYSCSFIQTDDLGVMHSDNTFEVLGRLEGSQIRGCNLLVTQ